MPSIINALTASGGGVAITGDASGNLALQTAGNTAATINTSKGVQFDNCIGVGNATPSTSGAGITFPATQSASSDANTLDDYEEGTWTPTISGISTPGTGTYSVQVGRYTKVGNLVTISARITWSAHTGTGNMSITGLPFVNQNVNDLYGSVTFGYVNNLALTANNLVTGISIFNSSRIDLYQYPVGGGGGLAVPMDTAADIIFTVTYMTA